jgi:hypothetical protein
MMPHLGPQAPRSERVQPARLPLSPSLVNELRAADAADRARQRKQRHTTQRPDYAALRAEMADTSTTSRRRSISPRVHGTASGLRLHAERATRGDRHADLCPTCARLLNDLLKAGLARPLIVAGGHHG